MSEPGRPVEIRIGSTPEGAVHVSAAERRLAATPRHWARLGLVAAAAFAADQVTKLAVRSTLSLDDSVQVVGPLSIRHVPNSGIAFGLFSRAVPVVIGLTAVAILWMLMVFARSGSRHAVLAPAFGLLAGGSLANLLDRLRLGHVTDFIAVRHWPTFNLADSFITIGVALLLVALLCSDRPPRPARLGPGATRS